MLPTFAKIIAQAEQQGEYINSNELDSLKTWVDNGNNRIEILKISLTMLLRLLLMQHMLYL